MTVRHPGISPTNDLVAKKIFSNQIIGRTDARMSENHPFPPFIIPQF